MFKIIRSQLYQLVLDKAIFLILIGWVLKDSYDIYTLLFEMDMRGETFSGGKLFVNWFGSDLLLVFFIAALVMTKDFFDKTLYYELLSGHSRTQVFMGRFMTALIVSETCLLLSRWTFPLIYTALHGWGENFTAEGALLRTLLEMLTVFRVCAEMALFTMLFRRKGMVFFVIPILIVVSDLVCSELYFRLNENKWLKKYLPWTAVFIQQCDNDVHSFEKVTLQDKGGLEYYGALPQHTEVLVICSLGLGVVMLIAACVRFGRKDME